MAEGSNVCEVPGCRICGPHPMIDTLEGVTISGLEGGPFTITFSGPYRGLAWWRRLWRRIIRLAWRSSNGRR